MNNQIINDIELGQLMSAVRQSSIIEWSRALDAMILCVDGTVMIVGSRALAKFDGSGDVTGFYQRIYDAKAKLASAEAELKTAEVQFGKIFDKDRDFQW